MIGKAGDALSTREKLVFEFRDPHTPLGYFDWVVAEEDESGLFNEIRKGNLIIVERNRTAEVPISTPGGDHYFMHNVISVRPESDEHE